MYHTYVMQMIVNSKYNHCFQSPLYAIVYSTHLTTKYIYLKRYDSACPLVGIGTLPPPLSPASVPLPRGPSSKGGGGGHTPSV